MVHFLYGQMKHAIDVAPSTVFIISAESFSMPIRELQTSGILGLSIMIFRYKVIISLRYWQ